MAKFADNISLSFGTSKDVSVKWTGSLLTVIPLTDDVGAINIGNGTKDIDFKIFLGTTAKYALFDVGNARVDLIGIPLLIGAQSNTATALALSATQVGALRVFSDDGGANIADSVRGSQSRLLLTTDQSAGSIRALQGQLKLASGIDVATGIYTAVQGYVEIVATSISSAGATFSCIDASLEIGTALTATGEVFGVHIETTGTGTLSGAGTAAGIGITKASGAASWPMGIFISPLAVTTAISVGTKANTSGSGVVIPSTDDFGAVRIFTDDAGANIADSVRALQSRTLLTISQSAGTIRTVQGQLKALTGVGFDTGVYTPVQGYIELAGTHTVSAAGVLACFDASIEIGTALTATGYVAGFKAELTGAGTCAAGLDCGFLVTNAAGAAVWTYGLYIEAAAADTGVYIGAANVGIDFSGMTFTPDAARSKMAFGVGSRATEKSITMAASTTQHVDPIQMNLNIIGSNPTGSSTINGIYQNITHDTTAMANLRLKCADWNLTIAKNVLDAYVYQGEIDYSGTTAVGGESAVMGLVMNAGAGAITGLLRGAIISMQGAAAAATCVGLEIRTTMGTGLGSGLAEGIRISGTPLPIVGIAFGNQTNDNEGPQFAFFVPSTAGADIGPWSATNASGDGGKIAIKVGTNTRYINVYNS
ncbi:MAG: hypothetical protein WC208_16340 [Gallionella sp.]